MKHIVKHCLLGLLFAVVFVLPVHAEETVEDSVELIAEVSEKERSIQELENITITLEEGTVYTYTGEEIVPTVSNVSFEDEEGNLHTLEEEFQVRYHNNTELGSADAVLTIDGYSGEMTVKEVFEIKLGSVSEFSAETLSYDKIKLNWSTVTGADGYYIYRSTRSNGGFTRIASMSAGKTSVNNTRNVTVGTTYYYKIRAYRKVDGVRVTGSYSDVISKKAYVSKPEIKSVKRATYTKLKIEWDAVDGASGYKVYRSTSKNGTYESVKFLRGNNTTSYTDKIEKCGKTYYYKVIAYRTYNGKNYYGYRSVCKSGRTTPARVNFNADTVQEWEGIQLCWKRSLGADGYRIYRSTQKDSGYTLINTITEGRTVNYNDTGLDENTTYYYKVRPYAEVDGVKVNGSYSDVYEKNVIPDKLVELKKYVGVKYRSGGNTPAGWDCSGFTQWAMDFLYGVSIPRSSADQANAGVFVNKYDMSKWMPGDILVYSAGGRINHVALYIGDGQLMHALNSKYGTIIQDVEYYESWDSRNKLVRVRRCF